MKLEKRLGYHSVGGGYTFSFIDEKTKKANLEDLVDMPIFDLEYSYQCRNHIMDIK